MSLLYSPAFIKTDIIAHAGGSDEMLEAILKFSSENYPIRRHGVVSDTTAAIVFLASEKASFITGTTLAVDGGSLNNTLSIMGQFKPK